MADIRVTSTGRAFYQIDNAVAALLREAFPASFEKIEPKATHNFQPQVAPTAPRFVVRKHPLNEKPEIVFINMNQEQRYPGPGVNPTAEGAQAAFTAGGFPVPEHVLTQFAAMLERAKGNDPEIVNEARLRAQSEQYSREQKERTAQSVVELLGR